MNITDQSFTSSDLNSGIRTDRFFDLLPRATLTIHHCIITDSRDNKLARTISQSLELTTRFLCLSLLTAESVEYLKWGLTTQRKGYMLANTEVLLRLEWADGWWRRNLNSDRGWVGFGKSLTATAVLDGANGEAMGTKVQSCPQKGPGVGVGLNIFQPNNLRSGKLSMMSDCYLDVERRQSSERDRYVFCFCTLTLEAGIVFTIAVCLSWLAKFGRWWRKDLLFDNNR